MFIISHYTPNKYMMNEKVKLKPVHCKKSKSCLVNNSSLKIKYFCKIQTRWYTPGVSLSYMRPCLKKKTTKSKHVKNLFKTHYRSYHLQLYFGAGHICTVHLGWV